MCLVSNRRLNREEMQRCCVLLGGGDVWNERCLRWTAGCFADRLRAFRLAALQITQILLAPGMRVWRQRKEPNWNWMKLTEVRSGDEESSDETWWDYDFSSGSRILLKNRQQSEAAAMILAVAYLPIQMVGSIWVSNLRTEGPLRKGLQRLSYRLHEILQ